MSTVSTSHWRLFFLIIWCCCFWLTDSLTFICLTFILLSESWTHCHCKSLQKLLNLKILQTLLFVRRLEKVCLTFFFTVTFARPVYLSVTILDWIHCPYHLQFCCVSSNWASRHCDILVHFSISFSLELMMIVVVTQVLSCECSSCCSHLHTIYVLPCVW